MTKLYVLIGIVAVVLLLALSFQGITVKMPPVAQTASQHSSCFGLFVSNSCNQAINQGQPAPESLAGILDRITMLVCIAAGFAVTTFIWLSLLLRKRP